jgi:hypothetical protein
LKAQAVIGFSIAAVFGVVVAYYAAAQNNTTSNAKSLPTNITIEGDAILTHSLTQTPSMRPDVTRPLKTAFVYFVDESAKNYTRADTVYNFSDENAIPHYKTHLQNNKTYLVLLQYWIEYSHYYCSAGRINITSESANYNLDLSCDITTKAAFDISTVLPQDP